MFVFKSSNKYKIQEFKRLLSGLDIKVEEGEDLKEVLGTMDEVIVHKALAAGENVLVEDTVLIINGKEEVEIRWKYNDLETGDKVRWIISLGVVDEGRVRVYRGYLDTVVDREKGKERPDGVVFEPFLVPLRDNPDNLSYTVLTETIEKDIVDPRAMAAKYFMDDNPTFTKKVVDIEKWEGQYQND